MTPRFMMTTANMMMTMITVMNNYILFIATFNDTKICDDDDDNDKVKKESISTQASSGLLSLERVEYLNHHHHHLLLLIIIIISVMMIIRFAAIRKSCTLPNAVKCASIISFFKKTFS